MSGLAESQIIELPEWAQAYIRHLERERAAIEGQIRKAMAREVDEWADSIVAAIGGIG